MWCQIFFRIWRHCEESAGEVANKGHYSFCGYEECWPCFEEGTSYMTVISGVTFYCTTEGHVWRLGRWKWWWWAVWHEFSFASIVVSLTLLQHSTGLSKLDSELVHLHGLLEKSIQTIMMLATHLLIQSLSDSLLLTPFIMKEWAHAMVSHLLILHY
jgi:hypothetical protein